MWPLYWRPVRLRHVSVGTSRGAHCCTGREACGISGRTTQRTHVHIRVNLHESSSHAFFFYFFFFSQPSRHSNTSMLRKRLIYRNADGVDGLSRRNEDTIIFFLFFSFRRPQHQGLETGGNTEMRQKNNHVTHLQSVQKLPIEVNDIRGACGALFTGVTLRQTKAAGQARKSQRPGNGKDEIFKKKKIRH